jgi:hypothetical protein
LRRLPRGPPQGEEIAMSPHRGATRPRSALKRPRGAPRRFCFDLLRMPKATATSPILPAQCCLRLTRVSDPHRGAP